MDQREAGRGTGGVGGIGGIKEAFSAAAERLREAVEQGGLRGDGGRTLRAGDTRSFPQQSGRGYGRTAVGEKSSSRSRAQSMARGVIQGAAVFLFGRAAGPLGCYPFGLSLMMALPSQLPFTVGGLVLAALCSGGIWQQSGTRWTLSGAPLPLMTAALVSTLLRLLAARFPQLFTVSPGAAGGARRRPRQSRMPVGWLLARQEAPRVLLTMAGCFAGGILRIAAGGFRVRDLLTTLLSLLLTPALALFYGWMTDRRTRQGVRYEIGLAALLFSAVYVLRGLRLLGLPLALLAAGLLTLTVSYEGGFLRGGVAGLLCGLGYSTLYAPVLALTGLGAGLFWTAGKWAAAGAAALIGVTMGLTSGGSEALRSFAPAFLCSVSACIALIRLDLLPDLLPCRTPVLSNSEESAAMVAQRQQQDASRRMAALSHALGDLSEVFYTLSDRLRRPGIYDVRRICHETFARTCRSCRFCDVCWTQEYHATAEAIDRLSKVLYERGSCQEEDVPDFLKQRCGSAASLAASLNLAASRQIEEMLQKDKTGIFAMDYEAMAKMIEENVRENDLEYVIDRERCEKLQQALEGIGLHARCMTVYGKRKLRVLASGVNPLDVHTDAKTLTALCEEVCGRKLSAPEFTRADDYVTLSMQSARCFRVERLAVGAKKKGEPVSGDGFFSFDTKEDYSYCLLSDGMGSGKEAALTARIVGIFLENMLRAGNRSGCTLRMLNDFIRCKNTECFATVDLLEVDLLSGEAAFLKCGASPSFILRSGSLFRIASNTMPIGITREISAEEVRFTLREDDVIVMMSDGAMELHDDGNWMTQILTEAGSTEDLRLLARRLLAGAQAHAKRGDDVTVGVIRVVRE